jgi:hypothetical protein
VGLTEEEWNMMSKNANTELGVLIRKRAKLTAKPQTEKNIKTTNEMIRLYVNKQLPIIRKKLTKQQKTPPTIKEIPNHLLKQSTFGMEQQQLIAPPVVTKSINFSHQRTSAMKQEVTVVAVDNTTKVQNFIKTAAKQEEPNDIVKSQIESSGKEPLPQDPHQLVKDDFEMRNEETVEEQSIIKQGETTEQNRNSTVIHCNSRTSETNLERLQLPASAPIEPAVETSQPNSRTTPEFCDAP